MSSRILCKFLFAAFFESSIFLDLPCLDFWFYPQVDSNLLRLVAYGDPIYFPNVEHPLAPGVPVQHAQGYVVAGPPPAAVGPVGPPAANQAVYEIPGDMLDPVFPVILQLGVAPALAQGPAAPVHAQGLAQALPLVPQLVNAAAEVAVNHIVIEDEESD